MSAAATSLTPEHPDWVGAWWLGFLVFGLLAAVVPLPLLAFPRRLSSGPPRHENSKESGRHLTGHRVLQGALSEMKGESLAVRLKMVAINKPSRRKNIVPLNLFCIITCHCQLLLASVFNFHIYFSLVSSENATV